MEDAGTMGYGGVWNLHNFEGKVPVEVKLKELLRNLTSAESQLCFEASKDLIKFLKSESGPELLRLYIENSPKCVELSQVWETRKGSLGFSNILNLIAAVLSHPFGRLDNNAQLDKFARWIVDEKMGDLLKELNSKDVKRQNATLSLLSAIVKRGSWLAGKVAKDFDFKIPFFRNAAKWKPRKVGDGKKKQPSTRKAFVKFAMSFLEVGNPRLLRGVLQQKDMYSGVLRGLGNDEDKTVILVLSVLRDRVLVPESLVPPGLRSVLFGSVTLEQLVNISGREDGGEAAELAHTVLLMVCTDPLNGLMPDPERVPSPLTGNPRRLLDVMKKLRATETEYHMNLLLAIVKGKPSLGSAYLDAFPYNTDDPASPNWFGIISLAADLILSVHDGCSFGFIINALQHEPKSIENSDIRSILKCICPCPFTRLIINKGLLHSDTLVKHGTLKLVLESLRFFDSLIDALDHISSSDIQMMHLCASLKLDLVNEVRISLPDPQVLFSLLSSLNDYQKILESHLKRAADSKIPFGDNTSSRKKLKTDKKLNGDIDIIVSGISVSDGDTDMLDCDERILNDDDPVQRKTESHYLKLIRELWPENSCSSKDTVEDAETIFYTKLLDVLKLYYRTMSNMLEGSFDFSKLLPSNPLALPIILQHSLLSLITESIRLYSTSEPATRAQTQLYKHLLPLLNLLIYSPERSVKDQAYILAKAAMLSTGAFDNNPREVCVWLMFIPGYGDGCTIAVDIKLKMFRKLSSGILSFLCDAVSTAGNHIFKYMDLLRSYIRKCQDGKDVSVTFSCFSICILEKCLRLLCSESRSSSLPDKSMISLYVSNTLKYILQTQVDARMLSSVLSLLLSERLKESFDIAGDSNSLCAWIPLKKLFQFSSSILQPPTCNNSSTIVDVEHLGNSFTRLLHEVRSFCDMESDEMLVAMGIGLSDSIICTQQADLLQNFPLTISVSNKMLGVPFPLLMLIFFLEPNFFIDVSKVWPEMFHAGLESAIAGLPEGRERTEEFGGIDSMELASASFSLFLRHAPFYMLFPVIPRIYRFGLSDQQGLQDLILASLSDRTPDYIISSFQYVLFCLKEAQRSYRVEPREELEKLCEWCFTIMDHMLRKLLHTKIDASSKCTRCLLPTKCVQELIETIFSHPALTAALECPLPCSADCTDIRDSMDNFFESNKWKMIHIMDLHAINFMRTASELFMDFGFDQSSSSVAFHARHVTLAFKKVVQKIIFTFRGSIDKCLEDKDLTPLFQKVCALHTLKQFISPFELLECVNWMFSRIDLEDSSSHLSFRDSFFSVALQMAFSVFCSLSACLRQPHSERSSFDVSCDLHEKQFDVLLLEKILLHVIKIATHLHLDAANMCLLQAFKIVKECGGMQKSSFSLVMAISRLVSNVPLDMLSYCMFEVTKRKAELLFLITQMSPVHLSIFGHLLSDMIGKHVHLKTNATRETSDISDPEMLMLLPTVFLYLDSVLIKAGSHVLYLETIASFYWRILLHVFFKWKCYVTRDLFDMECCDKQCLSMEEFFDIFSSSLLSTSVLMVQFCLALTGDLVKFEERLELFDSVCPQKSTCIDFLDFDPSQVSICSLERSLNSVNRTVAKIELCQTLLFPEHNKFSSWLSEYGLETPAKFQSNVDSSRIWFLRTLVSSWQKIVRKVPRITDESCPMAVEQCSVFRFLEDLILRNVVELCKEMQSCLLKLDSLRFIEKFAKTAILHRFDDPTTLQKLRNIISFLSEGKFSCDSIIKLMVNDSRFEPAIRSSNLSSGSSQLGMTFTPLPSLMRSFVTPCIDNNFNDKKGNLQVFQQHSHQLELIRLLRELFQVKSLQVDIESAEGIGINLKDLIYLLLSSYSATVSETDLEIYNLLNDIVSVSDNCAQGIAEWDYLWGNAVVQLRKERELTQSVSCNLSDAEGVEECCKIQFRENLPIDPRMCAHTVLYFPHWRADGPGIVNNAQKDIPNSMQEVCSVEVKNRHIYDPIFILRFSFHCLSMGYIEPAEFANLGLLAVSFASISSRDDGTRKLGYAVLEKFKDVLEKCQKKRDVTRLQLLLSYLQNCLEEDWQKIASITAIFIAEASFVILDRSHDRYSTITKQLMRSPSASFKGIPLFQDSFWSNSVNFRTDRLWILRLLYSGLNTDDDVHIYIRNSIFETLLSFYMSPLADNETKELIMQIVKKSTKLSKMVRHLIEHCGLISWLSSVVTSFCGIQYGKKKGFLSTHLALVLEVVNEIIFLRHTFEWLQKYALEQLSELSCHLCRILVEGAEMLKKQYSLTKLILQILTSTWKISQKRKVFQPHFTVSIEDLFNLCEAIDVCCKGCYNSTIARIGLEAVLMSAPPVAIIQADQEKVLKFVKWAISIALQSEETGGTHVLGSYRCSLNVFSEKDKENSLMSKLLRWLTASVILGKISYNLIKLESLERSKLINLQSLLEWNGKTYCDSNKDFACQEITLAASIFYMQQLLGTNYKLLPSVVSALCLLQHPTSAGSEVLICNAAHVTDLCSKIRCPAEANPSWRWAFYQPWKDHSSKLSDTEKIEEMHACQLLLLVFSKMLAGNSLDSRFILINDVEKLGVFEWEKSILCIQ